MYLNLWLCKHNSKKIMICAMHNIIISTYYYISNIQLLISGYLNFNLLYPSFPTFIPV